MHSLARVSAARAATAAVLLTLCGCSHLPAWPWHHAPAPPPPPVHELDITGVNTPGTFAQYWKRNTLLVDLSGARGSGQIVLKPAAGAAWPVRLAFRATPGSFAVLEVRAAERTSLPINADGSQPVDLELAPGIYTPDTPQMSVSWGPQPAPPQ